MCNYLLHFVIAISFLGKPIETEFLQNNDPNIRYVRGVYELSDYAHGFPIVHDAHFPIMFEVDWPRIEIPSGDQLFHESWWGSEDWKNMFLNITCLPGMSDLDELFETKTLFLRNRTAVYEKDFFCGKIAPHFASFCTSRENIKEYYKLLRNCGNGFVRRKVSPYHETTSNTTTKNSVSNNTILEAWLRYSLQMELLSSVVGSCQNFQLPWRIIDHETLIESLRGNPYVPEHMLAISLTEMTKYYKLPLTDCIFVGNATLLVRMLVPLMHQASKHTKSYRMIEYEPIVFHREEGEFCWIDGIRGKRYVADSEHETNLFSLDYCTSEQIFCLIPARRYASHDIADACAQSLYQDKEADILKHCRLHCESQQERYFNFKFYNIVGPEETYFIYALADDEEGIRFECQGKTIAKIRKLDFGAWNITHTCGCVLKGRPNIEYYTSQPCAEDLQMEKISPYFWRNRTVTKNDVNSTSSPEGTKNSEDSQNVFLWVCVTVLFEFLGLQGYMLLILWRWRKQEMLNDDSRLLYSGLVNQSL